MSENRAVESSVSARTKENPHGIIKREPKDHVGETLDRLRRMETKITLIMEKLDLNTQAQKVKVEIFKGRYQMELPSLDIRLKDILAEVSAGQVVNLNHKGQNIGAICR